MFTEVTGHFYRAVARDYIETSLAGSRRAGRYSSPNQPTLYLSASVEGVKAAMRSHGGADAPYLQIIKVAVKARKIFDLRDPELCRSAGVSLAAATAPWQELVAQGQRPPSWDVRERLEDLGAEGMIDPSRNAPGLWHLVLFKWNQPGATQVQRIDDESALLP